MMNFSNETINQIVSAINENMAEIKKMQSCCETMSAEENAKNILETKYVMAEVEAEEIVNDLKKGISDFDDQMTKVQSEGDLNVEQNLAKLSENMTEESRLNYYASILTALQALSSETMTEAELESLLADNKKLTIEELISRINQTINDDVSLETVGISVKENINPVIIQELASKIEMNKDEFRLNAALWLYMMQRDGKIKLSESDVAMPATTLGMLSAAGVETIITTNQLAQGTITLSKWQSILKWILGIVLFFGLMAVTIAIGTYGSLAMLMLLISIFGTSLLAFFVSMVVSVLFLLGFTSLFTDLEYRIFDWLSEAYDKYIVVLTKKIKGLCIAIKNLFTKTNNKPSNKVSGDSNVGDTTELDEFNSQFYMA